MKNKGEILVKKIMPFLIIFISTTSCGNSSSNSLASFDDPIPNPIINNTLYFESAINGNKVGMVRLIYKEPKFWSDDVTFGILNMAQNVIY